MKRMRTKQPGSERGLIFPLVLIVILFALIFAGGIFEIRNDMEMLVETAAQAPQPVQSEESTQSAESVEPTNSTVLPAFFNNSVPPEIVRGDASKKQVIFTFDGGGGIQSADAILSILKKHGVQGTFFVTGKWIVENPDLVKRMISEGHEVFNHTYNHPYLPKLSDTEIAEEFLSTEKAMHDLTGTTTRPYFRPPYGDRDGHVLKAAAANGFRSVYWTVDALDWKERISADEVRNRILSNVSPGAIYLMHIGDDITGAILDDVFMDIEAQGYRIVSLTQGT